MTFEYRDSAATRAAGITYHLASESEWTSQKSSGCYVPLPFNDEGFIHCTDGLDLLVDVANRYYQSDPGSRIVLVIDLSQLASPIRYDDPAEVYPHIYGPINCDSVIAELPSFRSEDGKFHRFGSDAE